jgi:hypothetical protein
MGTKNYNNYSDMITFTRASSGTALAKISGGGNLLSGDSSTFTSGFGDWVFYTGGTATVSNGAFTYSGSGVTTYQIANFLTVGKAYKITYDFTRTVDTYGLMVGDRLSTATQVRTPLGNGQLSGTITGYIICGFSSAVIGVYANAGGSGTIDNVIIEEVLYDQPDGTLQIFNHPTNKPRVEYDYQGNRLGLLVEEARTNTIGDSNVFQADMGTAVSSSAEIAPDGTTTATEILTSGTSTHRVKRNVGTVTATGVAYAYSVFVKSDEVSYIQLLNGGDANYFANFDLVNETVGSTGSATTGTITKYPNGWYRITALYDGTGNYNVNGYIYAAPSASATYGQVANTPGLTFHLFGAQNEAGSFPTSYIPTAGSTVTRAADVASIGVGAFGYNKTKNTIIVEASLFDSSWNPVVSRMISTTRYNEIRRDASGLADFTGLGITAVDSWPNDVIVKVGAASKPNDSSLVINGGTLRTSASGTLQYGIDTLKFGQNGTTEFTCMHLKSIAYYPRRLSDAQIKALTSPPETPTLSLTFDDSSTSYLETSIHG